MLVHLFCAVVNFIIAWLFGKGAMLVYCSGDFQSLIPTVASNCSQSLYICIIFFVVTYSPTLLYCVGTGTFFTIITGGFSIDLVWYICYQFLNDHILKAWWPGFEIFSK